MQRKVLLFVAASTAIHFGLLLVFANFVQSGFTSIPSLHEKNKNIQLTFLEHPPVETQNNTAVARDSHDTSLQQTKINRNAPATNNKSVPKQQSRKKQSLEPAKTGDNLIPNEITSQPENRQYSRQKTTLIGTDISKATSLTAGSTPTSNSEPLVASTKIQPQPQKAELDALLDKAFWHYFSYPRIAIKYGWQGLVKVGIRIESNGALSNIHIIQSSGYPALDNAAISSVKRMAALEGAQEWLKGLHYDTQLPILYKLMDS